MWCKGSRGIMTYFPDVKYAVDDGTDGTRRETSDISALWCSILDAIRSPIGSMHLTIWIVHGDGTFEEYVTVDIDEGQPWRVATTCLDNGPASGFSVRSFASMEEAGEEFSGDSDEIILGGVFSAEARGQAIPEDRWDEVLGQANYDDEWYDGEGPGETVQDGEWMGYPIVVTYRLPEDFDDRMNEAEARGEGDAYLRTLVSAIRFGVDE